MAYYTKFFRNIEGKKKGYKCVYCGSRETYKKGKRYMKDSILWRQRCFCKNCKKHFTAKKSVIGMIYRMRKHKELFSAFLRVVDEMVSLNLPISCNKVLFRLREKYPYYASNISRVTINAWLNKCYPNVKRMKNQYKEVDDGNRQTL